MNWIFLCLAGVFEIGWPVGMKIAQQAETRAVGVIISILCLGLSWWFLWFAQRTIPMGTAYAVWTGIGAFGAFCVGVVCYDEPAQLFRCLGALLIISGVVVMKLAH